MPPSGVVAAGKPLGLTETGSRELGATTGWRRHINGWAAEPVQVEPCLVFVNSQSPARVFPDHWRTRHAESLPNSQRALMGGPSQRAIGGCPEMVEALRLKHAPVAQRKSGGLLSRGSGVRIPPGALSTHCAKLTPGSLDRSSPYRRRHLPRPPGRTEPVGRSLLSKNRSRLLGAPLSVLRRRGQCFKHGPGERSALSGVRRLGGGRSRPAAPSRRPSKREG